MRLTWTEVNFVLLYFVFKLNCFHFLKDIVHKLRNILTVETQPTKFGIFILQIFLSNNIHYNFDSPDMRHSNPLVGPGSPICYLYQWISQRRRVEAWGKCIGLLCF